VKELKALTTHLFHTMMYLWKKQEVPPFSTRDHTNTHTSLMWVYVHKRTRQPTASLKSFAFLLRKQKEQENRSLEAGAKGCQGDTRKGWVGM